MCLIFERPECTVPDAAAVSSVPKPCCGEVHDVVAVP